MLCINGDTPLKHDSTSFHFIDYVWDISLERLRLKTYVFIGFKLEEKLRPSHVLGGVAYLIVYVNPECNMIHSHG